MKPDQIVAFLFVLQSFGVDPQTVAQIQGYLTPAAPAVVTVATSTAPTQPLYAISVQPVQTQTQPEPTTLGNSQPSAPSSVVVLNPVTPLEIGIVEVSPGGYLRIFTNKTLASTSVSSGTLADPLIDNYLQPDGTPYPGHVYEYKMSNAQRPFTATMTDQDSQTVTRTIQ